MSDAISWSRWRRELPASLWLGLLAVVATWPALWTSDLVGHPMCSAGCHAWVIWVARQVLTTGQLHSDLLFHPHGADLLRLYGSDLLSPLLLGPFSAWISPWRLYDLWVLLMVWANGLAAYALCRDRGASPMPAALGGTVFLSAPFFLHELFNGTSELVGAAALPLFALFWLRLQEAPSLRRGLLAGLVFGLGGLGSAYTPFFLLLVAGIVLVHRATTRLAPIFDRQFLRGLGGLSAVAGIILAPALVLHAGHGAQALYARRVMWSAEGVPLPDSAADLLGFVHSGVSAPPVTVLQGDGSLYAYWTLGTVTLGLAALVLCSLALLRSRPWGPWPALLVAALLLSMGPYLVYDGELLRIGGSPLPLPALLAERLFPPFGIVALHTYRFTAVTVLALSLLACRGAGLLLDWLPRARLWLGALLCLLVAGEGLARMPLGWPLPTTPAPRQQSWDWLALAPAGAVLTLPFTADELGELSWGLLAQTQHGKPWNDGGMHFRADPGSLELYAQLSMLAELSSRSKGDLPGSAETQQGLEQLRREGYRYVVLARERFEGHDEARVRGSARHDPKALERWLTTALGEPAQDDGQLAVFEL